MNFWRLYTTTTTLLTHNHHQLFIYLLFFSHIVLASKHSVCTQRPLHLLTLAARGSYRAILLRAYG